MMRYLCPALTGVLLLLALAPAHAVEILRWERLPLAVPLVVDQERVIFIDRNVRVGMPPGARSQVRVQSAGGALYLRASAPLPPTRLQLQDVDSGALILLDITAEPASGSQAPLEPVRIVTPETSSASPDRHANAASDSLAPASGPDTPMPVILTRHAAQNLYAPLRTIEPVTGIARENVRRTLSLDTLLPMQPVHAQALAAWRWVDLWVTAVRLTNTSTRWLDLDPRALQGDFVAATFQHPTLGPAGAASDTTMLYLITRGHGLAESLLPTLSPIDATVNLPHASPAAGAPDEK